MSAEAANLLVLHEIEQNGMMQDGLEVMSSSGSNRSHRSIPASLASVSSGSSSGSGGSIHSNISQLSVASLANHNYHHQLSDSARVVEQAHVNQIQTMTDLLEQTAIQNAKQNAKHEQQNAKHEQRALEQDKRYRELEQRMSAGLTSVENRLGQQYDDTEGAHTTEHWVNEATLAEDLRVTHRWWHATAHRWENPYESQLRNRIYLHVTSCLPTEMYSQTRHGDVKAVYFRIRPWARP